MDSNPWGFSFRILTKKLRNSSGPLTAGMTGEFFAEVIAELFPRIAPYAFPPAGFAFDRERVTEGRFASSSTQPPRSARLRARTACIIGSSASLPEGCVRVFRRSAPRVSKRRRFRSSGGERTSCCSKNRVGIRRRRGRIGRFAFSTWTVSCSSAPRAMPWRRG